MILNRNQVLEDFSFVENNTKNGTAYLCSCGHKFDIESKDIELKKELAEANKAVGDIMKNDSEFMDEFGDLYKNVNMSMEEKIECPSCKKSFLKEENRQKLITKDVYFVSGFKLEDDDKNITIYYSKIKFDYVKDDFEFIEEYKYIKFNKKTKSTFFKNYTGEEQEFDLDEIVKFINLFLETDSKVVYNAFDLHNFIGALTSQIVDSKSIDITNDMLSLIRNRHNDLGLDVIKKVIIVFLGMIKYSNLSTIAMTKGPMFLYDMMIQCKLPKPQVLIENKVTSPMKIFNFLAQNYVSELTKDISLEDKETKEFSYKSKQMTEFELVKDSDGNVVINKDGTAATTVKVTSAEEEKTLNINIKNNKNYKAGKVKDTGSGFGIIDAIADGTVSKFIFNNIKKFSDYQYIIKYFKIVNKQELIVLMQKYDLDFLASVIDLLYFRDKTDFKELQRILDLIIDYTNVQNSLPTVFSTVEKNKYECLKNFEFIPYDDSLMMMTVLKFDKKRHFEKIKTWKELNEYHDNLVKYFKTVKDEEKNGDIESFVSQFAYLEDRTNYDGPLQIILLSTPAMIIQEGIQLRHSGAAYAKNVASRTYLMGQVWDDDTNKSAGELQRYTIGFKYDKHKGLVFDQVKGFGNKLGSNRFKQLVMDWLQLKDVSFQPIKDLKID